MFFLQKVISDNGQEDEDVPRSGSIANVVGGDDIQVIISEQIVIEDNIGDHGADLEETEETSL